MVRRSLGPVVVGLAVLLAAEAAFAQRVVILGFQGDRRDRIRQQILRELQKDRDVELVSLREFQRLAAKKGFGGARAMTPQAVAAVSEDLRLAAAVDGSVRRTFSVQILAADGTELWSKDGLRVQRGRLSARDAVRLARAIATAAKTATPAPPEEPPAKQEVEEKDEVSEAAPPEAEAPDEAPKPVPDMPAQEEVAGEESEAERARRLRELERESHTLTGEAAARRSEEVLRDEELEAERRRSKRRIIGPKLVTVSLGGTTTWRAYCARPGVQSCAEYDARPEQERPAGDTVDFSPQVPYAGFGFALDFFPLASFDNAANGIGLTAAFSRGFSLTNVRVQTPGGDQPEQRVISIDDAWHAFGVYRYHFGYGDRRDPLIGYVGARGGIASRTFEVDPTARVPLPGSHRRFWAVGLEASIPVVKLLRLEASGLYLLDPKAGADEIASFGQDARGAGFVAEGGIGGDIWGPLGYTLKFWYMRFTDVFTGQGGRCANGGAAEETYSGLFWGLTAGF